MGIRRKEDDEMKFKNLKEIESLCDGTSQYEIIDDVRKLIKSRIKELEKQHLKYIEVHLQIKQDENMRKETRELEIQGHDVECRLKELKRLLGDDND